ncbi:MAG: hypothetical protein UU77_C0007G0019 [candidate division WWE3 bacterium GW2011_GWC1_41_7]|uniref:Uncharacterized protein n=2 Tax=Katanobacteria TaxID=422282 RepID=A0A0G0X811_UNCKA|nr:MAG: hypothetical protein UU77_C0007G0019 [candidate division WWE3 bacterium GW2011_GWC1_41_7]OGC58233.1 MAG: hypothetical protein A2976_03970 [candidate division WWE3 bacterium RIFCSPLOWO2_01_FULL_41_9]
MVLSPNQQDYLRKNLPQLVPQPYVAQLKDTLELSEAIKVLKLSFVDPIYIVGLHKIGVFRYDEGPYWMTIWANNGRPYIRMSDVSDGKMFDIFLLPKS